MREQKIAQYVRYLYHTLRQRFRHLNETKLVKKSIELQIRKLEETPKDKTNFFENNYFRELLKQRLKETNKNITIQIRDIQELKRDIGDIPLG